MFETTQITKKYIDPFHIIIFFLILFPALIPTTAHALSLDAVISDQSTQVAGGDRLYFEVDIKYPENQTRQDLRLEYQIKKGAKIIITEKVLRAVETQASFVDYMVVPKNIKGGIYTLNVIVKDYKGNINESVSETFRITKGFDETTKYFFIILAVILFLAMLIFFQIFSLHRKHKKVNLD